MRGTGQRVGALLQEQMCIRDRAVCVTSKYQLLEKFFEDGKEIVTYPADAPEQLPVVIDELLSNPGHAAHIAAAGRQKALQRCV